MEVICLDLLLKGLVNLLDCAALLHGAGAGRRCYCLCGCRLLDDGYEVWTVAMGI